MKRIYIKIFLVIAFTANFIYSFTIMYNKLPDYYKLNYDYEDGDIRKGHVSVFFPTKEIEMYATPALTTSIGVLNEPICIRYGNIDQKRNIAEIVLDETRDAYIPTSNLKYLPRNEIDEPLKLRFKNRLDDGEYYNYTIKWKSKTINDGVTRITQSDSYGDTMIHDTDGDKIWSLKRHSRWTPMAFLPSAIIFIGISIPILLVAGIWLLIINKLHPAPMVIRPISNNYPLFCPKCHKGYNRSWKVCQDCRIPLNENENYHPPQSKGAV